MLAHSTQPSLNQRELELFDHILGGEIAEVKKMLDTHPHLSLVKYAAQEEKITTNKGGQCIQIQGKTAYQIALGEEDMEMATILKACIVKIADEKEATAQYNAQFPEKWDIYEEEKWIPLFIQLGKLTNALRDAKSEDIISSGYPDSKLTIKLESETAIALANFKSAWDAILNEPITTGRHYNPSLLLRTFKSTLITFMIILIIIGMIHELCAFGNELLDILSVLCQRIMHKHFVTASSTLL